jgi:hypothetical protein
MAERKRRYAEKADDGRQPKARKTGFGTILIICIFLAILYSIYTGAVKVPRVESLVSPSLPSVSQPNFSYLTNSFDAQFLEYTHPSAQFKVKYPVGYGVESSNTDPLVLKLYSYGLGSQPVVVDFTLIEENLTKTDYTQIISSIPNDMDVKSFDIANGSMVFGENEFYVVKFSQTSTWVNEKLFLTYGFINCPKYSVMIEGIVPESAKDEQFVVNSALESFECG